MIIGQYLENKIDNIEEKIIRKRLRNCKLTDIKILSHELKMQSNEELFCVNICYGHGKAIKEFCGFTEQDDLLCNIEHGINLSQEGLFPEEIGTTALGIITFSQFRKTMLESVWNKPIIMVGPYIAYVNSFYPESQLKEIHEKNGKTLLVMPTHSAAVIDTNYDVYEFISQIERVKSSFTTVVVCLYWKDILRGIAQPYKEKGYKVVCAGYKTDYLFLNRLRTIIELSDAIMLNDVGTNLGYAMYLKKPCYIFVQNIEYIRSAQGAYVDENRADIYYELLDAFNNESFVVTNEQKSLCNYMFGIDQVKKRDELRNLIKPYMRIKKEG